MDPEPYDVLAVELSSFQLHYTRSMRGASRPPCSTSPRTTSTGTPARWPGYTRRQGAASTRASSARASTTSRTRPPRSWCATPTCSEGARAIGFTLGTPAVGMLGVVDDVLADRAFIEDRHTSAAELCTLDDLATPAPHYVANALAAAALARSHGVAPRAVRDGAAGVPSRRPPDRRGRHRTTASPGSTTPRPPTRTPRSASLQPTTPSCGSPAGWPRARRFDDLVTATRDRLRAVVLIGRDAQVIARGARATRAGCARDRGPTATLVRD